MNDKLFYKLWHDALAQPDCELYIAEYGYPEWFDDISDDVDMVITELTKIHAAAHMTLREIIEHEGLTQSEFACRFCIPLRTIENWATSTRECPDYVRLLIERQCGII